MKRSANIAVRKTAAMRSSCVEFISPLHENVTPEIQSCKRVLRYLVLNVIANLAAIGVGNSDIVSKTLLCLVRYRAGKIDFAVGDLYIQA